MGACLLSALLLAAGYLLAWPTRVQPLAWVPPPAPELAGAYAANDKLGRLQRVAVGLGEAQTLSADATGRVYAAYADGRVLVLAPNAASYAQVTNTGGDPLGIAFGPNGGVVIADARKGLLHAGARPQPMLLAAAAGGADLRLTDAVDDAKLGKDLYFTDASSKFGPQQALQDLLEHRGNGRLLRYNVDTRQTQVLLDGLYFPAGVAVGPGDAYVLVSETGAYRITRYWLKGDQAGTHDLFADNLPGFPAGIRFNGRDRFWLALQGPRQACFDALAQRPWLRKILSRAPAILLPARCRPERDDFAFVLAFGLDGKLAANLQYRGVDAFAPITSVVEYGAWIWLGSPRRNAIARLPANRVIAGAPAPPADWDQAPARPAAAPTPARNSDDD